jgi:hypothetical protein
MVSTVASKKSDRPRGRPPVPLPPVYWKLRVDFEPPELCTKHPALAKLLHWQIVLTRPGPQAQDGAETRQVVSIPSYYETDDGEKQRWLQSFGTADKPLHGWVYLRREPPADAIAVVRIRGLDAEPIGEVPLTDAQKIDQQLYATSPKDIARAAVNNPEILALIAEQLKLGGEIGEGSGRRPTGAKKK